MKSWWKWWVCALLLLASSINYMDRMTLASVAKRIIEEFSLSKANYGTIEQYFGYAFACGAIVFGVIVDRVSARWLYPLVLLFWSMAGLLTGFAGGGGVAGAGLAAMTGSAFGSLLLCRTILGFFEAGHWPCALQTTQRLLEPKDWAMANSILQSGTSVGSVVTPLFVGAMLTDAKGSWRLPFILIGAVGLVWVAAWIVTLRGKSLEAPPAPQEERVSWLQSFGHILKDHRFWLLVVVVSCINGTWTIFRVWLPLVFQDPSGLAFTEQQTLGRLLPSYYIMTDVGCLTAGAATVWLHRRGSTVLNSRRIVFTVCALIMMLGMFVPGLSRGEWKIPGLSAQQAATGLMMLVAAGSLGVFPCYYAFTQEISKHHVGLVTGVLSFCAWVVPSSLQRPLGAHIDRTGSYDIAFQVGAWPAIVSAVLLWIFWDWRFKRDET
ncbi:MAG: MFS transporter [Bryobacteraceae bacterium]